MSVPVIDVEKLKKEYSAIKHAKRSLSQIKDMLDREETLVIVVHYFKCLKTGDEFNDEDVMNYINDSFNKLRQEASDE